MTDKLWYKKIVKGDEYIRIAIQSYIDLYFFNSTIFKVVEDINLENLGTFLEVLLKHYEMYHFTNLKLYNMAEVIEEYFNYVFKDEEGDIIFPKLDDEDKRNLGLLMLEYIQTQNDNPRISPEDVPYLIEFLHAKDGEIVKAQRKLDEYLAQFSDKYRYYEHIRRWTAITEERKIALADGYKPLPIKPMSIELSKCLKD